MATGREIYERAIALVDEIDPETGAVSADTTEDYLARTPFLLSTLQTELMPYSMTRKKHEIVCVGGSTGWLKEDLPNDVLSVDDVITDGDYTKNPVWKTERNGNITEFYYDASFEGTIRISYIPVPAPVTDLDAELTIDDVTANFMAYGLAEAFINVEQNDFLQKIFKQKYDEQKMVALSNKPKGMVKIVDVYGGI
jgi:hypothetical protein